MATVNLHAAFAAQPIEDNNSRKSMVYLTDEGKAKLVQINENYGEALGFVDYNAPIAPADAAPDYLRFEMRRVYASDATGKVRQSFPVGSPDTPIYSEGGTILIPRKGKAGPLTLFVTGSVGEKKTFAVTGDTGQQSGDDT